MVAAVEKRWQILLKCPSGIDMLVIDPTKARSAQELHRAILDGMELLCVTHGVKVPDCKGPLLAVLELFEQPDMTLTFPCADGKHHVGLQINK